MIHCPSCGAGLRFDIQSQKMSCDLCGGGAKCVTYARSGRYDLPDPDCPFNDNRRRS